MHSNTANEFAVGTVGIVLATVAVDDPALVWLGANWIGLAIVSVSTMVIAAVTCVLSPAPSARMTFGRIVASGIFAAVVSVVAGSIHSSGNGPAAIAGIVLGCGIGGWMVWTFLLEMMKSVRESPETKAWFMRAIKNWAGKLAGEPRQPTGPAADLSPRPPLTPAERIVTRIESNHLPETFDGRAGQSLDNAINRRIDERIDGAASRGTESPKDA